jgi:2-succinyl-6-hydroxy-2,4-cyclohexadiene-1-carboxylate synthase
MPRLSLKQYKFSYELWGNKNHPKLFFLHGFMGSLADFKPIIEILGDQFCCLAIDLPGHGQTTILDTGLSEGIHEIAQSLTAFLKHLDFTPCHLIGYSMGGRLALYLACRFPHRFKSVVLESASPGLATEPERSQRQQQDEQLAIQLETGSWSSFLSQWYEQPIFEPLRHHPNFGLLLERRSQNRPQELAQVLRKLGTGNQPSLWKELSHIQLPIGLMVGELDLKFMSINQKMLPHCQDAQLSIVPDCGHVVHFEQPHAFTEILKTHLASHP